MSAMLSLLSWLLLVMAAGGGFHTNSATAEVTMASNAAAVSAYWHTMLPNTVMPLAILELLAPPAGITDRIERRNIDNVQTTGNMMTDKYVGASLVEARKMGMGPHTTDKVTTSNFGWKGPYTTDGVEKSNFGWGGPSKTDVIEKSNFGWGGPSTTDGAEKSNFGWDGPSTTHSAEKSNFGWGGTSTSHVAEKSNFGWGGQSTTHGTEKSNFGWGAPSTTHGAEKSNFGWGAMSTTHGAVKSNFGWSDPSTTHGAEKSNFGWGGPSTTHGAEKSNFGWGGPSTTQGAEKSNFGWGGPSTTHGAEKSNFGWGGPSTTQGAEKSNFGWGGPSTTHGAEKSNFGWGGPSTTHGAEKSNFGWGGPSTTHGAEKSNFGWGGRFKTDGVKKSNFGWGGPSTTNGIEKSNFGWGTTHTVNGVEKSNFRWGGSSKTDGVEKSNFGWRAPRTKDDIEKSNFGWGGQSTKAEDQKRGPSQKADQMGVPLPEIGLSHIGRVNDEHGAMSNNVFLEEALKPGSTITCYILPSHTLGAPLLRRDVADSIPMSTRNFTDIMKMFASTSNGMAADIWSTLQQCDHPDAIKGEKKACATSVESMVEFSASVLGISTYNLRAFSSPDAPAAGIMSRREYKVAAATRVTEANDTMTCHGGRFPFAVFMCHAVNPTKVYSVTLEGDGVGGAPQKMEVLAVCHLDTSGFHPSRMPLHVKPGDAPLCHFLSRDSILWAPAAAAA